MIKPYQFIIESMRLALYDLKNQSKKPGNYGMTQDLLILQCSDLENAIAKLERADDKPGSDKP